MAAKVLGTTISLITNVIVARVYGAKALGVLAFANVILSLASVCSLMGTQTSVLKLIPEYDKHSRSSAKLLLWNAQKIVVIASILVGVVVATMADSLATSVFNKPDFAPVIVIAVCVLPLYSISHLNTAASRGLQKVKVFACLQLLPTIAMLFCICVSVVLPRDIHTPVHTQMVAWVITALCSAWILRTLFKKTVCSSDIVHEMPVSGIMSTSFPMLLTAAMQFVVSQTGLLILSSSAAADEIGYYSIAVRLANLSSFLLTAINVIAAPKFSQLSGGGNVEELLLIARKSSRLIVMSTLPVLAVLAVLGPYLLPWAFGDGFESAYVPMLLLIGGQLVNSFAGSTGYFLNMTGDHITFRNVMFLAAVLNVGLSMALIGKYGMHGAAMASSATMIFWNVLTIIYIKRKYGRTISYFPFLSREA